MKYLFALFLASIWIPLVQAQTLSLGGAKQNAQVVYNATTGTPIMVIVDAQNLGDPAWHPPGSAMLTIPIDTYNSFQNPKDMQNYLAVAIPAVIALGNTSPTGL